MNDRADLKPPKRLARMLVASNALGFSQGSDRLTGALLRALAASKPRGRFLELGTGTGVGTAWLLDGMDDASRLLSVDRDPAVSAVARQYLGRDPRVAFRTADAKAVIDELPKGRFDLIFADAWVGKFTHLRAAVELLKVGGIYVVDDMIRQPTLPRSHEKKIRSVIRALVINRALIVTKLRWSTGIVIATKRRSLR
jgi:predicted O-methyltransferase YrrM